MTQKLLLKKTMLELAFAKEAVQKSEERYCELFEIVPEAIALLQLNPLQFAKLNTNALQMLEMTAEELVGTGPISLSPRYQPDGYLSSERASYYIQQTLNGESPVFEWLLKTGGGRQLYVEARLVLLSNYEEPLIYCSFVDITERKLAEARLREQNRSLSEIAFLQSHQVRQPVAQIMGLINLLKGYDVTDPAYMDIIGMIHNASSSFDDIIKKIVLKTHQISREL